jgi:flagellar biosynthesis/type III secretory pathway M-ring protein FliF/YscJ
LLLIIEAALSFSSSSTILATIFTLFLRGKTREDGDKCCRCFIAFVENEEKEEEEEEHDATAAETRRVVVLLHNIARIVVVIVVVVVVVVLLRWCSRRSCRRRDM